MSSLYSPLKLVTQQSYLSKANHPSDASLPDESVRGQKYHVARGNSEHHRGFFSETSHDFMHLINF